MVSLASVTLPGPGPTSLTHSSTTLSMSLGVAGPRLCHLLSYEVKQENVCKAFIPGFAPCEALDKC